LETIQTVFQDFKLVNGTWDVRAPNGETERVRPQDIQTTALFTVEGELDDISGSGQTHAAQTLCAQIPATQRKQMDVAGAGHYGIFSGRRWRELVYPQIRDFIQAHHSISPAAAHKAPAQQQDIPESDSALAEVATNSAVSTTQVARAAPAARSNKRRRASR
ncbi:MAG: polyhydroxyalkanoate depolymerase, partial [Comamonas sp.]|nr:polyhydroxyalkanoate depolymerase [Candidatus Comamonas equi]